MSNRTAAWLAWSLWALTMAIFLLGNLLDAQNNYVISAPISGTLVGVIGGTIGALIASRRPSNLIGWLFLGVQLLITFGGWGNFAYQYAYYTLAARPGALPAGDWVLRLGVIAQVLGFFPLVTFLLLLFPDGHPLSPRWRWFGWFTAGFLLLLSLGVAFDPLPQQLGSLFVDNPLGVVAGAASVAQVWNPISTVLGFGIVTTCILAAFLRFRRARGNERQQLKWFAFSAAFILVVAGVSSLAYLSNSAWLIPLFDRIGPWQLSVAAVPIATGIAIFKYRLYDIDILIRRTLIYSILTAILALFYSVGIVILQQIFRGITGQESDIAIIISTLAIAALFNPLRKRIQGIIDRRFFRRKYDAQKVLAQFAQTARDETDLNKLTDELIRVVDETMQPQSVGVWLKSTVEMQVRKERENL